MKPIDRIDSIIKHYGLNVSSFEKSIGASNNSIGTAIRRKSSVKDDTLNDILNKYPEISAEWILTGKGSMITGSDPNSDCDNNVSLSEKFRNINTDELVQYLISNFDDLQSNQVFNLLIEKEVWKKQVEMGKTLP